MTLDDFVRDREAITQKMIAAQGVLEYINSAIRLHVKDAAQTEANVRAAALILTITGGADQIPTAGAVEVEVIYLAASDLANG